MMQSNTPYYHVSQGNNAYGSNRKESLMDGFVFGGMASAGTVGAAQAVSSRRLRQIDGMIEKMSHMQMGLHIKDPNMREFANQQFLDTMVDGGKAHTSHKKYFGTGKRRAMTYGASVLAGGLVGMGMDAATR